MPEFITLNAPVYIELDDLVKKKKIPLGIFNDYNEFMRALGFLTKELREKKNLNIGVYQISFLDRRGPVDGFHYEEDRNDPSGKSIYDILKSYIVEANKFNKKASVSLDTLLLDIWFFPDDENGKRGKPEYCISCRVEPLNEITIENLPF